MKLCVYSKLSVSAQAMGLFGGKASQRERVLELTVYTSQQGEVGGTYPHSLRMPLGVCPFCMYFEHLPSSY